ncbi:MAG TPA: NAD(P)-dependent oxidoreductase [Candidatus Acidoferrales bacterium]|jgi:3-hydroxyisobutyrate dehydrogenase|nr:NAD(P)-dependent oxidoreductase [Candidatus Acidoferrales bacterium]
MTKPRVAILGLGLMGAGMAGRVLTAGFPLAVYNRDPEKTAPFAKAGAYVARTPRDAGARADIIITMLTDDNASRAVWLDKAAGALAAAAPGTWLIESSTASVPWIHELAAAAKQHQCELLDAPVTGSKPQAAAGELLFLVGGSTEALAAVRPVLAAMSRDVLHLGPTGSGATLKLINNFLCGVQAASIAEAMALVTASGLDREKSLAMLAAGAPGSPLLKVITTRAAANDYTPNFILRLMAKDLTYAREEGARHGIAMNTATPAIADFEKAIAAGYGEKDFSAVIPALQKK